MIKSNLLIFVYVYNTITTCVMFITGGDMWCIFSEFYASRISIHIGYPFPFFPILQVWLVFANDMLGRG